MAKEIVLSILIPTYNRAPYLNNLLNYLNEEIYNLDFTYEIVVSDNASTFLLMYIFKKKT
jgi:glycosyltransferase involved in cell wall biosynthesis